MMMVRLAVATQNGHLVFFFIFLAVVTFTFESAAYTFMESDEMKEMCVTKQGQSALTHTIEITNNGGV